MTIPLATAGTPPTRVRGPVSAGDTVGVDDDADFAYAGGAKPIGQVLSDYAGSEIILIPVRLGVPGKAEIYPLQVLTASTSELVRVRVRLGRLGGLLPAGMTPGDDPVFYLTMEDGTNYIVGKVSVDGTGNRTGATITREEAMPALAADAVFVRIATVIVEDGEITSIGQAVRGDLSLTIHASYDGTVLQGEWDSLWGAG